MTNKTDLTSEIKGLISEAVKEENLSIHLELKEISTQISSIQETLFSVPNIIKNVGELKDAVYGGTKPEDGLVIKVRDLRNNLTTKDVGFNSFMTHIVYPAITSVLTATLIGTIAIITGHLQWH